MFTLDETVRIKGERPESINEFARVVKIYPSENKVWISNLNSPFAGSISAIVDVSKIEKA